MSAWTTSWSSASATSRVCSASTSRTSTGTGRTRASPTRYPNHLLEAGGIARGRYGRCRSWVAHTIATSVPDRAGGWISSHHRRSWARRAGAAWARASWRGRGSSGAAWPGRGRDDGGRCTARRWPTRPGRTPPRGRTSPPPSAPAGTAPTPGHTGPGSLGAATRRPPSSPREQWYTRVERPTWWWARGGRPAAAAAEGKGDRRDDRHAAPATLPAHLLIHTGDLNEAIQVAVRMPPARPESVAVRPSKDRTPR